MLHDLGGNVKSPGERNMMMVACPAAAWSLSLPEIMGFAAGISLREWVYTISRNNQMTVFRGKSGHMSDLEMSIFPLSFDSPTS